MRKNNLGLIIGCLISTCLGFIAGWAYAVEKMSNKTVDVYNEYVKKNHPDTLIKAIAAVEGDDCLQISEICLADYNRISGEQMLLSELTPSNAAHVFRVYTAYYIRKEGIHDCFENRARIWNGGPRGYQKDSTIRYWAAVSAVLEVQSYD